MVSRYVGVDLHCRRSVVVILDEDGERLSSVRIENTPLALAEAVGKAGLAPEVVLEATWGAIGLPMCSPKWEPGCIWRIR